MVASSASGPGASAVHGRASTAVPGAPAWAGIPSRRRRTSSWACLSTSLRIAQVLVARVGRLADACAAIGRPVAVRPSAPNATRPPPCRCRARTSPGISSPGSLRAAARRRSRAPRPPARRPRRLSAGAPVGAGDRLLEQRLHAPAVVAPQQLVDQLEDDLGRGLARARLHPQLARVRAAGEERIVSRSSSSCRPARQQVDEVDRAADRGAVAQVRMHARLAPEIDGERVQAGALVAAPADDDRELVLARAGSRARASRTGRPVRATVASSRRRRAGSRTRRR